MFDPVQSGLNQKRKKDKARWRVGKRSRAGASCCHIPRMAGRVCITQRAPPSVPVGSRRFPSVPVGPRMSQHTARHHSESGSMRGGPGIYQAFLFMERAPRQSRRPRPPPCACQRPEAGIFAAASTRRGGGRRRRGGIHGEPAFDVRERRDARRRPGRLPRESVPPQPSPASAP